MEDKATLIDYLKTAFMFPMTVIISFLIGIYAMSLQGSLQYRFNHMVNIMVYVLENHIITAFSIVFWFLLLSNLML